MAYDGKGYLCVGVKQAVSPHFDQSLQSFKRPLEKILLGNTYPLHIPNKNVATAALTHAL